MDSARSWFHKFQPRDKFRSKTKEIANDGNSKEGLMKPPTSDEVSSNVTKQQVAAAKQHIENHYKEQMKNLQERKERQNVLERKLADADVSKEEQNNLLKYLEKKETEYMRLQRHKMRNIPSGSTYSAVEDMGCLLYPSSLSMIFYGGSDASGTMGGACGYGNLYNQGNKQFICLGDGKGDFCPSTKLRQEDYMMPRKDYPVWELICSNPSLIKAEVNEWSNWEEQEQILLRLINTINVDLPHASISSSCKLQVQDVPIPCLKAIGASFLAAP